MKKVLPDIISNDQTGFSLKGKSIGENDRLIDSIVTYAESHPSTLLNGALLKEPSAIITLATALLPGLSYSLPT